MQTGTPDDWFGEMTATLGDRLTAAREARGMSVGDFARLIGVRGRTVAQWEADASEPRGNRMQMIAGALGVSLGWLMTGTGQGGVDADAAPAAGARQSFLTDLRHMRADLERMTARIAMMERLLARDAEALAA